MRHLISKIFLSACCVFVGCKTQNSSVVEYSTWSTYKLDKFWLFDAPKGTRVVYIRGIDSTPGNIVLPTSDSLHLEFDSGYGMSDIDTICSMESELANAKREIARGAFDYLDKPDTLHQAAIDTVNGQIATIITPLKTGGGTTEINISDCKSHRWLGIYGKNIPSDKQELALKIYRSIRHESLK